MSHQTPAIIDDYLTLAQVIELTNAIMLRYGLKKSASQLGFATLALKYVAPTNESSVTVLWSRWLDSMSRQYVEERLRQILTALLEDTQKRTVIVDMIK